MITVTECELHALFQPGTATFIKTPFVEAFPSEFRARLERARARELRPIPAWQPGLTEEDMYETHAFYITEETTGYKIAIAVFESDPRKAVPTVEAALDMIDVIKDEIESVPRLRSFVLVQVIEAVPGLGDDDVGNAQWDELEAYIRAAGAGPW
jgi:hypothetical protein